MSMYDFIITAKRSLDDSISTEHKKTNEKIEQLEKRIESLEVKLDSILTLLKERQEIKAHIPANYTVPLNKIQKLIK